eukprot:8862743-Heterocapsa_arctica.AAC.1
MAKAGRIQDCSCRWCGRVPESLAHRHWDCTEWDRLVGKQPPAGTPLCFLNCLLVPAQWDPLGLGVTSDTIHRSWRE